MTHDNTRALIWGVLIGATTVGILSAALAIYTPSHQPCRYAEPVAAVRHVSATLDDMSLAALARLGDALAAHERAGIAAERAERAKAGIALLTSVKRGG